MGLGKKFKKAVKSVGHAVSVNVKNAASDYSKAAKGIYKATYGNAFDMISGKWARSWANELSGKNAAQRAEEAAERAFQENKAYDAEMFAKSEASNLANWTRQNQYNSPAEQMARLKDAGLNPNLMYSQGNVGNATAVSASDPGSARREAVPGYGFTADDAMKLIGIVLGISNFGIARETNERRRVIDEKQGRLLDAQIRAAEYEQSYLEKIGGTRGDFWATKLLRSAYGPLDYVGGVVVNELADTLDRKSGYISDREMRRGVRSRGSHYTHWNGREWVEGR